MQICLKRRLPTDLPVVIVPYVLGVLLCVGWSFLLGHPSFSQRPKIGSGVTGVRSIARLQNNLPLELNWEQEGVSALFTGLGLNYEIPHRRRFYFVSSYLTQTSFCIALWNYDYVNLVHSSIGNRATFIARNTYTTIDRNDNPTFPTSRERDMSVVETLRSQIVICMTCVRRAPVWFSALIFAVLLQGELQVPLLGCWFAPLSIAWNLFVKWPYKRGFIAGGQRSASELIFLNTE